MLAVGRGQCFADRIFLLLYLPCGVAWVGYHGAADLQLFDR